jgi:membrane protein implicated in regulation of membrane protease activity
MDSFSVCAFAVFLALAAVGCILGCGSAGFGEGFEPFVAIDDHGGPGCCGSRVVAGVVSAFGGAGAVATHYGLSAMPSAGIGLATGLVFGGAIYMFARFLYDQQASSEVRAGDLVGQVGRVIVAIPAGGVGQIRCRVGEELVDKVARTSDGLPVAENQSVQVEDVLGETVIVKPR